VAANEFVLQSPSTWVAASGLLLHCAWLLLSALMGSPRSRLLLPKLARLFVPFPEAFLSLDSSRSTTWCCCVVSPHICVDASDLFFPSPPPLFVVHAPAALSEDPAWNELLLSRCAPRSRSFGVVSLDSHSYSCVVLSI